MQQTTATAGSRQPAVAGFALADWTGRTWLYRAYPITASGKVKHFRLVKLERTANGRLEPTGTEYDCSIDTEANTHCTCPQFEKAGSCKHLTALADTRLLDRELIEQLLNRIDQAEENILRAQTAEADALRVSQAGTPADPFYAIRSPQEASAAARALAAYRKAHPRPRKARKQPEPVAA